MKFIRKNGRVIPIRDNGEKSIKLPISGERLNIKHKMQYTSSNKEQSVYGPEYFKPRRFLGLDMNTTGDEETYKKLKKIHGKVINPVDRKPYILINKKKK